MFSNNCDCTFCTLQLSYRLIYTIILPLQLVTIINRSWLLSIHQVEGFFNFSFHSFWVIYFCFFSRKFLRNFAVFDERYRHADYIHFVRFSRWALTYRSCALCGRHSRRSFSFSLFHPFLMVTHSFTLYIVLFLFYFFHSFTWECDGGYREQNVARKFSLVLAASSQNMKRQKEWSTQATRQKQVWIIANESPIGNSLRAMNSNGTYLLYNTFLTILYAPDTRCGTLVPLSCWVHSFNVCDFLVATGWRWLSIIDDDMFPSDIRITSNTLR